jgi:mevalonate kinase
LGDFNQPSGSWGKGDRIGLAVRVSASAPGKLMLFGEHAVVYGYPCIVTAVDLRYHVAIEKDPHPQITIETPGLKKFGQTFTAPLEQVVGQTILPRAIAFVLAAIRRFYGRYPFEGGLRMWTAGPEISYGLGSSSAVTVAAVAALAEVHQVRLLPKEIFSLAMEAVLEVQGSGSGFDVAAAVFGGSLYYEKGGEVIEPLGLTNLPVVIGFSGDKVSTMNLIEMIRALKHKNPQQVEGIFHLIGSLVQRAKGLLQQGDWRQVGELANINQGLLEALGVGTLQLSRQIYAARQAGAYGAKLSGAGGGDCMFALVSADKKDLVTREIEKSGGTIVALDSGTVGVRIENN